MRYESDNDIGLDMSPAVPTWVRYEPDYDIRLHMSPAVAAWVRYTSTDMISDWIWAQRWRHGSGTNPNMIRITSPVMATGVRYEPGT